MEQLKGHVIPFITLVARGYVPLAAGIVLSALAAGKIPGWGWHVALGATVINLGVTLLTEFRSKQAAAKIKEAATRCGIEWTSSNEQRFSMSKILKDAVDSMSWEFDRARRTIQTLFGPRKRVKEA